MEISQHREIQTQIVDEINSAEADSGLPFLDSVVLEVLRKYPPIRCGTRSCTKDCIVTLTKGEVLKFVKGDLLHIPFHLMQNDRKVFRHPEMFNPHRFESASARASLYPFGLGPRSCLGKDFALFQAKLLIVAILRDYSVQPCDKPPKTCTKSADFLLELIPRKTRLLHE